MRKEKARNHILAKHPFKEKLVKYIMDSQLFADYLDELEKKVKGQWFLYYYSRYGQRTKQWKGKHC